MSIKFYVRRKGLDTQMNEIKDNYAPTATATATAEPRNREWKIIKYWKNRPAVVPRFAPRFSLAAAVFIFQFFSKVDRDRDRDRG